MHGRNPGKFGNTVEKLLYAIDHDQQVGESGALGWYGLVSGLLKPEAIELAADLGLELDPDDLDEYDWPLNAIIREGNDGTVDVATFTENRDVMREWREIEREYERYDNREEKNPRRSLRPKPKRTPLGDEGDFIVDVWEERGYITITVFFDPSRTDDRNGLVVAEWSDDDARQMFEDGFFKSGRKLGSSVLEYLDELGVIRLR